MAWLRPGPLPAGAAALFLFTPRRYDSLPGLPFPGNPEGYPTRDEVVAYLEDYAARFQLPVELNSSVLAVRDADGRFEVELADRSYTADQIRPLLEAEGAFTPDDIPIIAQAFDEVLRVKRLVDRTDPAVLMIARLTIQVAMTGERDPVRITQAVLDRLSGSRSD